jgi:hypothetical protein
MMQVICSLPNTKTQELWTIRPESTIHTHKIKLVNRTFSTGLKMLDFPLHPGMPSPEPSSKPALSTNVAAVETFLADTPFASQSTANLAGGFANHVYRKHLLVSLEGIQLRPNAHPIVLQKVGISAFELIRQARVEPMSPRLSHIDHDIAHRDLRQKL